MTIEVSLRTDGAEIRPCAAAHGLSDGAHDAEAHGSRLRALVEESSVGMFHTESDGRCRWANPALSRLYGRPREELLHSGLVDALVIDDRSTMMALFTASADSGEPRQAEVRVLVPDGTERLALVRVAPVSDGTMNPGFIGIAEDVTVRRTAEIARVHENRLTALGSLAAGVAHDFSNMLAVVLGNAELATSHATSPAAVIAHVGEIQVVAARSRELVKKILHFGRAPQANANAVDLLKVVRETYRLLSVTFPPELDVTLDLPALDMAVAGTEVDLQHVLVNLMVNAQHALKGRGSPRMTIRVSAGQTGTPTALVEVADNGVGMSGAVLERIFEPYFTTRGDGAGTGLGLSVVHGVVTRLGGSISAQSVEDQGTVFTMTLPLLSAIRAQTASVRPKPLQVLVVDDDADLVEAIGRSLERVGHAVTVCTNAMQALRVFDADPSRFDVVLADVMMPAMNGFELMAAVHRTRHDVGVLLMTGYREALKAPGSGPSSTFDVIVKPIVSRDLVLRINDLCARRTAS